MAYSLVFWPLFGIFSLTESFFIPFEVLFYFFSFFFVFPPILTSYPISDIGLVHSCNMVMDFNLFCNISPLKVLGSRDLRHHRKKTLKGASKDSQQRVVMEVGTEKK
jgi:hypothetical protein